jgi:hypothetical protein
MRSEAMMNGSEVNSGGHMLRESFRSSFGPEKAFTVCGLAGLAVAILLSMATAVHLDLSAMIVGMMGVASFATLLAMGMLAKLLTGSETLIYYRGIVAICVVDGALLRILHQPVLRYLDIAVLGVGVFLAFGRVGCLLVGCCHGRPATWGICYGEQHARCGFPSHYVGVRLFPIQLVESLFVFCLVALGTHQAWVGAKPGRVFSVYIVGYAVVRFFIEFARGDAERPYFWNFSEPQWTSALLVWCIVLAEQRTILWSVSWHVVVALVISGYMILIALIRRFDPVQRFRFLQPQHIRELACAIRTLSVHTGWPSVITLLSTSRGITLSGGTIHDLGYSMQNYCISRPRDPLRRRQAELLARTLGLLQIPRRSFVVHSNAPGVFHLLARKEI